ncbi:MAG: S8 family serine peptidase [Candidatus Sericytochromatia bacterium]|nr:S8 family serine peptidase [Candidatus Tanganyikabacteria bacterium]
MKSRLVPASLLALGLVACSQPAPGSRPLAGAPAAAPEASLVDPDRQVQGVGGGEYAPGVILVKAGDAAAASRAAARAGGKVKGAIGALGVSIVELPGNADVMAAVARAHGDGVEYAEPDYIAHADFMPDDPYANEDSEYTKLTNPLGTAWHLGKIGARQAWDGSRGEVASTVCDEFGNCQTTYDPVKVAVCDTGIDLDHPDLASKIVHSEDFTGSGTADDGYGHGSHVAGIAAGLTHNGTGIAGTGFNAALMNFRVLDSSGNGQYSWIANGIVAAADNGARIINLSLGGSSGSQVLLDAVNYAYSTKGALVVASAGNSNSTKANYPAYYANAFAVAATTKTDARAYYSNHGSWVDIAAPGGGDTKMAFTTSDEMIWSAVPGGYAYKQGTSMAAPVVSGVAALVWARYPALTNAQVRSRLQSKGDTLGWASYMKRVNANRAVNEP